MTKLSPVPNLVLLALLIVPRAQAAFSTSRARFPHPPSVLCPRTPRCPSDVLAMSWFAESVGSMAAKEKESDSKRKNSAKFASWVKLGASGFTALHKVDLGSQVFTVAQIVTYMETLAQDNPKFLTFRLSVVLTQKLALLVQALVGNPNVTAVDHTTRVFVSDFWDVSPQDNKKPRTTLALYFVGRALRAAATVLDLLVSSQPLLAPTSPLLTPN